MSGSMDDRDTFLAEIERLGEDAVRKRIEAGEWSAIHRKWASEWLAERGGKA